MALTLEQIAKDLKGIGPSTKDRIVTATNAWHNKSIFFPNKADFLFDWVCTWLAKANLKNLDECPLLYVEYWNLLSTLLDHYTNEVQSKKAFSVPTIRVHLIPAMSSLLKILHDHLKDKTEAQIELLKALDDCASRLFSTNFVQAYRPSFEQLASATDQLLDVLMLQLASHYHGQILERTDIIIHITTVVVQRLQSYLAQVANQRKAFTTLLGKLFHKILCVRRSLLGNPLSDTLTTMLKRSLFHPDIVMEFTSVLTDTTNMKHTSFVAKLFEEVDRMIKKPQNASQLNDVLDVLPVLFDGFVEAFRKKRSDKFNQTAPSAAVEELAFAFFSKLFDILKGARKSDPESYTLTLRQLLEKLVELDVYFNRGDKTSQTQHQLLESIMDEVMSDLECNASHQSALFSLAQVFFDFDVSFVENHMQIFWQKLIQPLPGAENAALLFAMRALHVYSAMRQVDVYIGMMLEAIDNGKSNDVLDFLKLPIYSHSFLLEFSICIKKHLPALQTLNVLGDFENYLNRMSSHQPGAALLITPFMVTFINTLSPSHQQENAVQTVVTGLFESFVKPNVASKDPARMASALEIHFALSNTLPKLYWSKLTAKDVSFLTEQCKAILKKEWKHNGTTMTHIALVNMANVMLQHVYLTTIVFRQTSMSDPRMLQLVHIVVDAATDGDMDDLKGTSWNGRHTHLDTLAKVKLAFWKLITNEWFEIVSRMVDLPRAKAMTAVIVSSDMSTVISNTDNITLSALNVILLRSAALYDAHWFKEYAVSVVSMRLAMLLKNDIQMYGSDSSALSSLAQEMINGVHLTTSTQERLVSVLKHFSMVSVPASHEDLNNLRELSQLLKCLLLFPSIYFDEDNCVMVLYLSILLDLWSLRRTTVGCEITLDLSLQCRGLYARIMKQLGHAIPPLFMSDDVLCWFSTSLEMWNTTGVQDFKTFTLLKLVTRNIDQITLKSIFTKVGIQEDITTNIKDTLNRRLSSWIDDVAMPTTTQVDNLVNILESIVQFLQYTTQHWKKRSIRLFASSCDLDTYLSKAINHVEAYMNQFRLDMSSSETRQCVDGQRLGKYFSIVRYLHELNHHIQGLGNTQHHAVSLTKIIISTAPSFLNYTQGIPQGELLDIAAPFLAALCISMSPQSQPAALQHVLAVIFFLYSRVCKGDKEHESARQAIDNAVIAWFQSATLDQFEQICQSFLDQLRDLVQRRRENDSDHREYIYIILFALLCKHCTNDQKNILRPLLPDFLSGLAQLMETTTLPKTADQLLKLFNESLLTNGFRLNKLIISLILTCLAQIIGKSALDRFGYRMDHTTAHTLFEDTCRVLTFIAYWHRYALVYTFPPYLELVQAMMHCFSASLVPLASNQRKRPCSSDKNQSLVFSLHAPLSVSCAQLYTRVLETLTQRTTSLGGRSETPHTYFRTLQRYSPYILYEYFNIQSSSIHSIVDAACKAELTLGLYTVMDICQKSEQELLMAMLESTSKTLLQSFYTTWKDQHKYKGQ